MLKTVAGLLALTLTSGCGIGTSERIARDFPMLGTWVRLTVVTSEPEAAEQAIQESVRIVEAIERACNFYDPDSELCQVNLVAASKEVAVTVHLWRCLEGALRMARETEGAFDPTVGPLVRLWGLGTGNMQVPSQRSIDHILPCVSYRLVVLDPASRTVRFKSSGVQVDLGAIAKGYAVDQVSEVLRRLGVQSALVQAGGSIWALGQSDRRRPWTVGIQHPRMNRCFYAFSLESECVATSGDYQNYFETEGVRYHHVLNPQTGWPVRGAVSATVVMASALEADAYSTALMVYADDKGRVINTLDRLTVEKSGRGLVVLADGTIVRSEGWGRAVPRRLEIHQ